MYVRAHMLGPGHALPSAAADGSRSIEPCCSCVARRPDHHRVLVRACSYPLDRNSASSRRRLGAQARPPCETDDGRVPTGRPPPGAMPPPIASQGRCVHMPALYCTSGSSSRAAPLRPRRHGPRASCERALMFLAASLLQQQLHRPSLKHAVTRAATTYCLSGEKRTYIGRRRSTESHPSMG
jgi:hypothetical protein